MGLIRRRRPRRLLFVTGGRGFLGRHVLGGPEADRWELLAPDSRGLDLRNRSSVVDTIRDWAPTAIIHTAYRLNDRPSTVDATRNVAEAAVASGARLIHMSTDMVFAGGMSRFTERDRPNPISEYGRQKVDSELIVSSMCPDSVTVRTSLLIGRSALSRHEIAVRDAIEGRNQMAFFDDEIRCPVLVDDLAATLVELTRRPEITGLLHLVGPQEMSRAQLARVIARRHGWDATRLRYSTLAESGLDRPARLVLDSSVARSHGLAVRGPTGW
jgi:dTDP-4-dehydrorhamnose reductase